MLLARIAGKGTRLPAVIPRRLLVAHVPAWTSQIACRRQQLPESTHHYATISDTMLRGAVKDHEQKNGPPHLSQSTFPSSQSKSTTQSTNPGYRPPLKQSSASAVNEVKSYQTHRGGIKRTASGLAKAMGGSFDDERPGSQYQPIVLGGGSAPPEDFFGENDFDSDIDLDVEEPLALGGISYPELPKQTSRPNPPKQASRSNQPPGQQIRYPTLPTARSTETTATPSRGLMSPPARTELPGSSAPLPWSSSPLEHFSSALPQQSLQKFAFDGRQPTSKDTLRRASPEPKPAKRRTLPWQAQTSEEPPRTAAPRTQSVTAFTPLAKEKKDKNAYPWNTTASAIKEGQKKHREESKKTVKNLAGTDESIAKAKSTNKRPARVFLSDEQQHVLDLVIEQKKSAFFTGSAGTGKSVLMREIIACLRKKYSREPDRVAVTASTGLAACNVGGVTLHSFAGIGLGKEDIPELVKKIKRNQKAKHRWMRTKVLVVDEVSMVDGDLFDKLEAIARQIRNNARPFGGIQLVITGDFFQLPPVPEGGRAAKFAFDASTWSTSIEHTIGLHHVFRQKDPVFAGMLNEMREGRLTESSTAAFRKLSRPLSFDDMLDATELFPTRNEVEGANANRLHLLQGNMFPFPAKDGGSITDKGQRDRLLANCLAPELITLKKGAQVMLIKNIDETLVNGSLGRVIGFMDERQFDSYNNNEDAFMQSPGGTVQSTTDAAAGGEAGDRPRMMEGITTSRKWPLVRFAIADGTWRDLLCQPETWKVELPNGEVQASRAQVPLILAWALSIHKAQGQTLERVKVDLGKVFEKGQAYVALSRATSMAGLQVLRFDPKKVNAHERVRTFYSKLARVELAEKNKDRMEKISKAPAATTARSYEENFVDGDFM